ncbi:HAMP domain-containing sensor histidine kinase [Gordonia sp. ABSL1-1]|uniref:sensor histidine kinase n=1 Tax=Gordonia sp. ABSL1-1 TaxID=3053923 RepID=UPI0025734C20|nr:HAMP domain-containing sensor histidine kinase [Gordonia sp. ABSL1-1]MDL9937090.1 HAMP domain-containing sensor histidine kinase [Gordonia sp. ABSL1-1]
MRRRILTVMIAMLLAVGALLGIPLSVIAWRWVADNAHQDLDSRLKVIADQLIRQEDEAGFVAPGALTAPSLKVILPDDGRLTLRYHVSGRVDEVAVGAVIDGPTVADSIGLGDAGTLILEIPRARLRDDQTTAVAIVAVAVAASVAAGTVVAAVTAGRLADPLTDLADRAAAMARGDFGTEWKRYGIPELDRVSSALGDANAEIALRLEREGQIVGDVSHQLRSRLTAIQLRLDELSLHDDPRVVVEAEAALAQVERLAGELDDMVAAARADREPPAVIDVRDMLTTLAGDFRQAFDAQGRELTVAFDGEARALSARPGRLREAVSVLVDNALQHGAGRCRISVGDLPSADMVRISVSDEGDGVPDPIAAHIFRRGFSTVRPDAEASAGRGVGLSLARALVEADGGRLELTTRRPPIFAIVVPSGATVGTSNGVADGPDGGPPGGTPMRDRVPHR